MTRSALIVLAIAVFACGSSTDPAGNGSVEELCNRCIEEPFITTCRDHMAAQHVIATAHGCSAEWQSVFGCLWSSKTFCSDSDASNVPNECNAQRDELSACKYSDGTCQMIVTGASCGLTCDELTVGCTSAPNPISCHCDGFGQSLDFMLPNCDALDPATTPCTAN